jgi:hypothetical protein
MGSPQPFTLSPILSLSFSPLRLGVAALVKESQLAGEFYYGLEEE